MLLLDGEINGGSISEYLPRIKAQYPNLKIILLWIFANTDSLTKWVHLLDGHLNLGVDSEEIIRAIEAVMLGEKYFTVPVFKKH